jgi:predicted amidohydrolase
MNDLRVTLIQTALHWESPGANLAMLEEKLWLIGVPTDVIVLPEMFTTGFTMNAPALAEPMNLTTFKWMKGQAARTGAVVTGSYIVKENGQYFNRLVWMQPNGAYHVYDKRHLFRMAHEHDTYAAGGKRLVTEWKGWRICPMVCYDLRFPVWSRNGPRPDGDGLQYDVLLYVANWPQPRRHAWSTLLKARAIENLSYAIGVNRVGLDGKGHAYGGDSAVINFKGEPLFEEAEKEVIHTQTLSYDQLVAFRTAFPAHMDGDAFELK